MQRLGRNRQGYLGETIDIGRLLGALVGTAEAGGWTVEEFGGQTGLPLRALTRPALPSAHRPRRIYLSAGIHADEPAGPLALFDLIRTNSLPLHFEYHVCPCLNPEGFTAGTRHNPGGIDLNRDYNHLRSPEVRAHVAWLGRQPAFDLALMLHEDWESNGFYLYELNPDGHQPDLAGAIVSAVEPVCPIERAEVIDGRAAHAPGIIRPSADPAARPDWPEAFWLLQNRCRRSFTLEAPSDFPLATRMAALSRAALAALA